MRTVRKEKKCLFLYLCTCDFFSYTIGIKEGRAFPLENSSPCSSDIQLVYLLPRLGKYLSCFCESQIPLYNLPLQAQGSLRESRSLGYALCTGSRGKNFIDRTTKTNNYLRLCRPGLRTLFTVLAAFANGITRYFV